MSNTLDAFMEATDPNNRYQIPTLEHLNQEINTALYGLVVKDDPLRPFEKIKLVYPPLEELLASAQDEALIALNEQLVEILDTDFMFGATRKKSKKTILKAYDKGFEKLKSLAHPNVLIHDGKVMVLTQNQLDALKNDAPTCNCCSTLMIKREGRYGTFFACKKQCKKQKNVSADYWDKIRKK